MKYDVCTATIPLGRELALRLPYSLLCKQASDPTFRGGSARHEVTTPHNSGKPCLSKSTIRKNEKAILRFKISDAPEKTSDA